jgi:phosphoesterase RecJ-like protein
MTENGNRSQREETLRALREADKLICVTHENPDGDALGSLIAMQQTEFPLPQEYRFLPLSGVVSAPPEDVGTRTVVFLDCGNLERNPAADDFQRPGMQILNIDHHHDNTRFGTVNLVDEHASCTAEIVWDLMHGLGVAPTPVIASALYVGLITDTGRFMYENTGPRAHVMAAELIEAGVDVHDIYRHVYEDVPYGKLALLARGLANVRRYDDGRLTVSALSVADYESSGAEESYSEGVIDHLRAVEGTAVAALVRDRIGDADGPLQQRKVSLRATDDRVDVSAIARAQGGGGHRQAAGFSTTLEPDALVEFLREQVALQLA